MQLSGLKFDQIPSLDVPFRFYFVATIFAFFTGCFIAVYAEQLWLSRWTPSALSVTHLFVLGMMAMVMFGSLFQLLPVLCGAPVVINGFALVAFQVSFSLGVVALVAYFNQWADGLIAFGLLSVSTLLFISILLRTLLFSASGKHTQKPMVLAVFMLLITVLLGLVLLSNYPLHSVITSLIATKVLTNIHALIGVFGWVLLLVVTVGFQVIPMFHVAPEFPMFIKRFMPYIIAIEILVVVLALLIGMNGKIFFYFLLGTIVFWALVALKQLSLRKRKLPDNTVYFWQVSIIFLIIGALLLFVSTAYPELGGLSAQALAKIEILIAILLLMGFVLSVIQGMLLKIIPFLVTLHLQRQAMQYPMAMGMMPDHYSLISRAFGKNLLMSHVAIIVLMSAGIFHVYASQLAGVLLAINWGALGYQIFKVSQQYQKTQRAMACA